jgi:FG-GAP-like repeat/Abnormal spindle-like microcephaly-assoc'd, ASPM-SPD-2-Hydin/FG-GAP repeat
MKRSRSTSSSVVFLLAALVVVWSALGVLSTTALAQNPVPFVNQPLVPDATSPGGPEFTLTVNGTGFVSGSVVNWNGSALATQFVSGSQLTATVPATNIATATTASVTVVNSAPGGGTSNVAFFTATRATSAVLFGPGHSLPSSSPTSVVAGDFNGDGKLDLAVASFSAGTISFLYGNGDSTFQSPVEIYVGFAPEPGPATGPTLLFTGDFDDDGKTDLVTYMPSARDTTPELLLLLDGGYSFSSTPEDYDVAWEPIAVGDFNGDGMLDLALGVPNFVSVCLGTGNTFQWFKCQRPPSSAGGIAEPRYFAVGDFNGDGMLDLVVINDGSPGTVSVLLGDGAGGLTTKDNYVTGDHPSSLVTGDFNADGKLDLAVTTCGADPNCGSPGTVSVLLGDGGGNFTLVSSPAVGLSPASVAVGDFNGDGKLDLAVGNNGSDTVSILLGDGKGSFTLAFSAATGSHPDSLAVGDFNRDGRLDLVVANSASDSVSVLPQPTLVVGPNATLLPTNLTFPSRPVQTTSPAQTITLANYGSATLTVIDIAASGDFAETNTCGGLVAAGASCTVSVTFTPTVTGTRTGSIMITDDATDSPQVLPLTGTGITGAVPLINLPLVPDAGAPGGPDFTLTVNGTGFVADSVVNWNGSALATQFVSGSQLTATVPAADIATASTASVTVVNPLPGGGASNVAFFTVASNAGNSVSFVLAGSPSVGAWDVAVGDFNGDGKLDLAVGGGGAAVLLGDGTGNFTVASSAVAYNSYSVAVGDFNGDGNLDLAFPTGYSSSQCSVTILLGDGRGNLLAAASPVTGFGSDSVAVGDFNQDGALDLAVANACGSQQVHYDCFSGYQGTISILLGDGTGNFTLASSPQAGYTPGSAVVGDFNGDGKLDLAVVNSGDPGTVSVLLGDGGGNFAPASVAYTGGYPGFIAVGDFDGDGIPDLATANTDGTVSILRGDGMGNFTLASSAAAGSSGPVVAADFNGDGKLDLAVNNFRDYYGNTVSILLGDGSGNLTLASTIATGSNRGSFGVGDFNGDGKLDLAVTDYYGGTVSILLQVSSGSAVALSPTSLSFGTQLVSATSSSRAVKLTNTGSVPVVITGVTTSGDFAQTSTCGGSVPAGASCTINVTFTPTAAGTWTGAVTITDNAPGSPHVVSLTGTGMGPAVSFSASSLSFGYHMVGTAFGSQTVTLTNTGNAALSITSMATPAGFTQTNTCGASVEAGASCSIQVTFTPTAAGAVSANLTMTDNAPGSPHTMSLTGIGTATPVVLSPQYPTPLEFGSLAVGSSATLPVLVANAIDKPLTLRRLIVSPRTTFSQANNCGASLAPSLSCTIAVTFAPTTAGARHGIAIIIDNSRPRPVHLLRLSGQAVATAATAATGDALRPAESSPASGSPAPGLAAPVEASPTGRAPTARSNSGQRALNLQRPAATCTSDDAKEPKDDADLDSWASKLEKACEDSGPQ